MEGICGGAIGENRDQGKGNQNSVRADSCKLKDEREMSRERCSKFCLF